MRTPCLCIVASRIVHVLCLLRAPDHDYAICNGHKITAGAATRLLTFAHDHAAWDVIAQVMLKVFYSASKPSRTYCSYKLDAAS